MRVEYITRRGETDKNLYLDSYKEKVTVKDLKEFISDLPDELLVTAVESSSAGIIFDIDHDDDRLMKKPVNRSVLRLEGGWFETEKGRTYEEFRELMAQCDKNHQHKGD